MSRALLDYVVTSSLKKVPAIKPGSTVKVYQKIKEGEKERVQIFQGLVIRLNAGAHLDKTFTVRKIVEGVGVERIFPMHTPNIEKIVILKQGKVRRAKLYYMRNLQGKSTRLRESAVEMGMVDEPIVEQGPAEEVAQKPVAPELSTEERASGGEPSSTDEPAPEEEQTTTEEAKKEPAAATEEKSIS